MNFVYRDMEVRDSPLLLTCSLTTFDFEDKDGIVQIRHDDVPLRRSFEDNLEVGWERSWKADWRFGALCSSCEYQVVSRYDLIVTGLFIERARFDTVAFRKTAVEGQYRKKRLFGEALGIPCCSVLGSHQDSCPIRGAVVATL
jgi:hypothetical protein